MAEAKRKKTGGKPDLASLGGLVVAVGGILTGLILEGGKVADIQQFTAALIVLGGTIGAVLLTTPMGVLLRATRQLVSVFLDDSPSRADMIDEIIEYATVARKKGIVSLEQQAEAIDDRFLRKALTLAVDGIETNQIRSIMELEITILEQDGDAEAKVFEAAGGYAPTVGIIGAVLGLIQVMKNLANIDEVGRGIAVAFVATVYGVGSANILFLPVAAKMRARVLDAVRMREMMLEGVLSIVEGLNPKLIRTKLQAYEQPHTAKGKAKADGKAHPAAEPVSAEG